MDIAKKEIGIFGDSYAALPMKENTSSWVDSLVKEYPGQVDVFAKNGSSLEYSVSELLYNHLNYNNIILVTTWMFRLHWPVIVKDKKGFSHTEEHWPGLTYVEDVIANYEYNSEVIKIRDYFINFTFGGIANKYEYLRWQAMLQLVRTTRPDAIIIPAYNYVDLFPEYKGWDLFTISNHEISLLDQEDQARLRTHDFRPTHMSRKSNEWMLAHVKGRLLGEFINLDLDQLPRYSSVDELKRSL